MSELGATERFETNPFGAAGCGERGDVRRDRWFEPPRDDAAVVLALAKELAEPNEPLSIEREPIEALGNVLGDGLDLLGE